MVFENEFRNPIASQPQDACAFLRHCDLSGVIAYFREVYPRFKQVIGRLEPRLKFALFMLLKNYNKIAKAHRDIICHPEKLELLGFAKIPTYETLREFINEKVPLVIERLFDILIIELKREAEKHGIRLFVRCGEDATDIRAKDGDDEAEYSGYYHENDYKKDILVDMENGVVAPPIDLGINDNEGICLIPQLERLNKLGMHPTEMLVDGKYATYRNIAHTSVDGRELIYRIQDGWVHNPKGEYGEIKKRYGEYWKCADYKPGADIECTLRFLLVRGDEEYVGAYYRNKAMANYKTAPKKYLKRCCERSKDESFNSYIKTHLGFEANVPKGKKKTALFTTLCLFAVDVVALTRLQNGVKKGLTSTVYLS